MGLQMIEEPWNTVDAGGPTVSNGMLYVNSGYGRMPGQPGNVLMALDGK